MTSNPHPWKSLSWTFGDRVRKLRTTMALDQRTFARQIGVTPASLGAWELGVNQPRHEWPIAVTIGQTFGVNPRWLLGQTDDPRPDGPDGGQWAHWESNPEPAVSTLALVA